MDHAGVTELLVWHTIHGGSVEHYFEAGQAAHLLEEPGTVVCTDSSVHLETLDNGHVRASLGAGIAYRAHDGVDRGEGVTGRADASQVEGQAAILGIAENPGRLALGMDNLSYLHGLSVWQHTLLLPSPHNHRIREVLKEGVKLCAQREEELLLFWVKGHAGMEVNVRFDRQADAAAKQEVDREWHETDYDWLVYEDPTEEESWYRPGPRAKKLARQQSAQYEVQQCNESITSNWLLREDQGRQYLGQLWKRQD
eukprot:3813458-Rhodomonas_salina.3